jgi:hypothetical protein
MSGFEPHPSDNRVQQEIEVATLSRLEEEYPNRERAEWKATSADLNISAVWRGTKPDAVWLVRKKNSSK